MAKSSGLGDALYVAGNDLSGDIQSVDTISGGPAMIDTTDITQSANSRLGGRRDGKMQLTTFFDPATSHPILSALPTADTILTYCRGTALGSPAASINSRQLNYDGTLATDGGFTFKVEADADGFGLEWGVLLTAGVRTDSAATNGTSIDTLASAAFGGQAYLHVMAFTGTDATVNIQDSADNSTFANVTSFGFAQITSTSPQAQRIAIGNTATIRRYVRAVTVTTGGFTNLKFAVAMTKNPIAGQAF